MRFGKAGKRSLLVGAFVACLFAATQQAQAEWVVVPYGAEPMRKAERAAELIVRALSNRRVPVISLHETRDRLRARSQRPSEPQAEDARAIAAHKDAAVEDAAFGRRDAARRNAEQGRRARW
jgi:hypothetical protein